MAKPAALRAIRQAGRQERQEYNADELTEQRENTPVVIGGLTFKRRRKNWDVSRAMREAMRAQEKAAALGQRVRARITELEVEQIEAATKGDEDAEAELEAKIDALVQRADEATQGAELVTYRLLALLLVPPAPAEGEDPIYGWGPDEVDAAEDAIAFLQPALDVEDAAGLATELTGSVEPDPQQTPSTENGST